MKVMRRILGVLVMSAGILGLVLSLTGLVGVWVVKPTVAEYANATIVTLNDSVSTSQQAMEITGQALGADDRKRGCALNHVGCHRCYGGGHHAGAYATQHFYGR